MSNLAYVGMVCALCFSAIGSGLGAGMAAQSAVGGWKKCYAEGKPAPFIMVAFAGAPLTQTIYGFLLMNFINSAFQATGNMLMCLGVGVSAVSQSVSPLSCRVRLPHAPQMHLPRQVRVLPTTSS